MVLLDSYVLEKASQLDESDTYSEDESPMCINSSFQRRSPDSVLCREVSQDEDGEDDDMFAHIHLPSKTVTPCVNVRGLSIFDMATPSRRSFTPIEASTSYSDQVAPRNIINEVATTARDPDAMIVFDVHDTIRQIEFTKKRKSPVPRILQKLSKKT